MTQLNKEVFGLSDHDISGEATNESSQAERVENLRQAEVDDF